MALKIDILLCIQGTFYLFRELLGSVVFFQFFSSADLFLDLSGAIQTLFHEAHL